MTRAEKKARTLLRRYLSREQSRSYGRGEGFIEVSASGRRYRIGERFRKDVIELSPPDHRFDVHYCIVFCPDDENPTHRLARLGRYGIHEKQPPVADILLTALLMIRYDEQSFRSTAEPTFRPPDDYVPTQAEIEAWEACYGWSEMPPHVLHPDAEGLEHWIGIHSPWPQAKEPGRKAGF